MSISYEARKEGTIFFAKEVSDSYAAAYQALERERVYLARIDHPGIVKYQDFLRHEGHSYLVVDLVAGHDLEVLVSRATGFLAESVVIDWACQVVSIFRYLHAQDPPIIYRDLKPNNLMHSEGKIVLIDFGSVRHFKKDKSKDTEAFGTVMTASPEHYGGQTSELSDIYCFGATLHFLLTLGSPNKFFFDFPDIKDANPNVSEALCQLVKRCVEIEPTQRFQSFMEVEQALAALCS